MSLCVVALIFFYLKANPKDVGLPALEDQVAPDGSGSQGEPNADQKSPHFLDDKNPAEALWAFARSGRFWLMCSSRLRQKNHLCFAAPVIGTGIGVRHLSPMSRSFTLDLLMTLAGSRQR